MSAENHNGWYNKVFSAAYDPLMGLVEKNALAARRQALLSPLTGKILELGCGTGINFGFYSDGANVLALEPSDAMRAQAEDRQALATLIEQLPEAGDTAVLSRARALRRATKTA